MTKIYIVTVGEYPEGQIIKGVFSSESDAGEVAALFERERDGHATVAEYDLDEKVASQYPQRRYWSATVTLSTGEIKEGVRYAPRYGGAEDGCRFWEWADWEIDGERKSVELLNPDEPGSRPWRTCDSHTFFSYESQAKATSLAAGFLAGVLQLESRGLASRVPGRRASVRWRIKQAPEQSA